MHRFYTKKQALKLGILNKESKQYISRATGQSGELLNVLNMEFCNYKFADYVHNILEGFSTLVQCGSAMRSSKAT